MKRRGGMPHLSDEELDDVLIGAGSPEAEAHLAECAACADRTAAFSAAMASFNQATLAWSEATSHTLTRDLTAGVAETAGARFGAIAAGVCGLAVVGAVLGAGVGAGLPGSRQSGDVPASVAGQTEMGDRDREIAGDNVILEDIDAALYRPDPSPEQTYRISAAHGGSGDAAADGVRE